MTDTEYVFSKCELSLVMVIFCAGCQPLLASRVSLRRVPHRQDQAPKGGAGVQSEHCHKADVPTGSSISSSGNSRSQRPPPTQDPVLNPQRERELAEGHKCDVTGNRCRRS